MNDKKDGHIATSDARSLVAPWGARLDSIAELEDGWLDGENLKIDEKNISKARLILEKLYPSVDSTTRIPGIFPLEDGVSIEWGHPKYILTVEVRDDADEAYFISFADRNEDAEIETDNLDSIVTFTKKYMNLVTTMSAS